MERMVVGIIGVVFELDGLCGKACADWGGGVGREGGGCVRTDGLKGVDEVRDAGARGAGGRGEMGEQARADSSGGESVCKSLQGDLCGVEKDAGDQLLLIIGLQKVVHGSAGTVEVAGGGA